VTGLVTVELSEEVLGEGGVVADCGGSRRGSCCW